MFTYAYIVMVCVDCITKAIKVIYLNLHHDKVVFYCLCPIQNTQSGAQNLGGWGGVSFHLKNGGQQWSIYNPPNNLSTCSELDLMNLNVLFGVTPLPCFLIIAIDILVSLTIYKSRIFFTTSINNRHLDVLLDNATKTSDARITK